MARMPSRPNVVVFLTDQQRWDTTGLPVPKEMQGRSAVPLLHDRKAVWGDDVFVQVSESETARAARTQRWKYGVVAPDCDPSAAGSDHYVEAYLFDLMADPMSWTTSSATAHTPTSPRG